MTLRARLRPNRQLALLSVIMACAFAGCADAPRHVAESPVAPDVALVDQEFQGNTNGLYGGVGVGSNWTAALFLRPDNWTWEGAWADEPAEKTAAYADGSDSVQGFSLAQSSGRLWFAFRDGDGDQPPKLGWYDRNGIRIESLASLMPPGAVVQGNPRMWGSEEGVLMGVFTIGASGTAITVVHASDVAESVTDFTVQRIPGAASGNAFVVATLGDQRLVASSRPNGQVDVWRAEGDGLFVAEVAYTSTDPTSLETLMSPKFLPDESGDASHLLLQTLPLVPDAPTSRAYGIQIAAIDRWEWATVDGLTIRRAPEPLTKEGSDWLIGVDGTRLVVVNEHRELLHDEELECRVVGVASPGGPLALLASFGNNPARIWSTAAPASAFDGLCDRSSFDNARA